jgi:hypothetical protein
MSEAMPLLSVYAFTMWTGEKLYVFTLFYVGSCLFVGRNLIKTHVEKLLYMFAILYIIVIIHNQKGKETMCL